MRSTSPVFLARCGFILTVVDIRRSLANGRPHFIGIARMTEANIAGFSHCIWRQKMKLGIQRLLGVALGLFTVVLKSR